MVIQFVDLAVQIDQIRERVLKKMAEIVDSRSFIRGRYVDEFAEAFCRMHGAQHGVGCSNGTSAIFLALAALGIGEGDEVITVPHTFMATAEGICHTGAKPVFVDVDEHTLNMDVSKIEGAITDRTKAILPVHLYGNPAQMNGIMAIAKRHGLYVVEDAAQAHFAKLDGQFVGSFGHMATFSFYPGKNLGAFGDAGFLFAQNAEFAETARKLGDHGRSSKYEHDLLGYNHRMDDLQAGVLSVKLDHIMDWTQARRSRAALYRSMLSGAPLKLVTPTEGAEPVYHLFVIRVANRKEVIDHLRSRDIATGIHYPVPLHLQPALADLGHTEGDFPISERAASQVISLPMYAELSGESIEKVVEEVRAVARI